ncbi:WD40/YVTN/BNR-like repeat-containing protein [Cohnella terricola]|uniref:Sortilin N-terminal domain-containing protein n=1 Tax=Cohnella terricola TaxID=1289167 RepID=A0A559JMU9_9BACL|nr:YCF48-related protein [Cohnella terricola]TVY01205.1 hypothetical protein FPZ45_08635 [Cohnella terricola]
MKSLRQTAYFVVVALLAVALAGCSNQGNSSGPPGTTSQPPAISSPELPPPASSSAEPEQSATPSPSASASPISISKESPQGKVTALRLADFKTGWAGGAGWIARTDDGGKTWQTQLKHKYIVLQLFALNGKEAWAALDTGDAKSVLLMHTTDGGKKWTGAGNVPNRAFLHFVSSKEAFSGNVHTTDGGKTWTKLQVPASAVGDVYFHDRSNGWAVTQGNNKFNIMRTTDGGKSWKIALTRDTAAQVTGTVIRSAGKDDAWVELIGDSGMSQTSYSLFHTKDGGKSWIPVLANNQAGSGPAPGYKMNEESKVPRNNGAGPGTLYVANTQTAFMGGQCMACDLPNTMGKTVDGGKTWVNLPSEFAGYGTQQIAVADSDHIWWVNTDNAEPSVMYTSLDGGKHWTKTHSFGKPK